MPPSPFVPADFDVPTTFSGPGFRLEPLGPEHNASDHAAWMSSIGHIHDTPGFRARRWPPAAGMSPEENLADLRRHAEEFRTRTAFAYAVLAAGEGEDEGEDEGVGDGEVIGCVYLHASRTGDGTAQASSWVRADRAALDKPLYEAVSAWLAADWPLGTVRYEPR
ncbi:N-acetyltransferase [Streptomyces huiliensis]|uniref:N-acetyltransferase n=1 Tax=Streptomyces huiliensis TaxID=2876027 RepID=UPI001CC06540|nr:N-acetyltransferase [Streptomyces huiliensis]MBZ4320869.1 N-acetyltransferase [Streptomyces huiliensis]